MSERTSNFDKFTEEYVGVQVYVHVYVVLI